jgi:hypothetical protein
LALAAHPSVYRVQEDRLAAPHLADSARLIKATDAWAAGYTGSGQTVAILDTGVLASHPFFGARVVEEACYSTTSSTLGSTTVCPNGASSQTGAGAAAPCSSAIFGCDHGTHVAGIAAGFLSTSFAGIARAAQIVAIQVFSRFDSESLCGGSVPCILSYSSDQIRGLERVLELSSRYSIASVNMSLGGGQYFDQASCDAENALTKAAIDNLRAAGIATVVSAGNEGQIASLGSPACISTAFSIGASTKGDALATTYSNSAYFLDFVAPGSSILSATTANLYTFKTGTSMAAPHAAGAWAVLRSARPTATVDEIARALRASAAAIDASLADPSTGRVYGYRFQRLDVSSAIAALARAEPTPATGWWWNPNESGRGFAIESNFDRLFLGGFMYEFGGTPSWSIASGSLAGRSAFSGSLAQFANGQTLSGAYRAPATPSSPGPVRVDFTSSTTGLLSWPGGRVPIQRFDFVFDGSGRGPASGMPATGWWWNRSESGRGYFVEVQGSTLYFGAFMYDESGQATWYVSTGAMTTTSVYEGTLLTFRGGQSLYSGYRAPTRGADAGAIRIVFLTTTLARLTLPNGTTVPIERFTF